MDSRAAFQRCRSAISHRLRFCPERMSGVREIGRGQALSSPRPRVECQCPRPWWVGTPLRSFVDSASWTSRPYRHLDMARTDSVDTRLPLLFPWYGWNDLSCHCQCREDQVRHRYDTKDLSSRDPLPRWGSLMIIGKAWVEGRWTWTWRGGVARKEARRERNLT